MTNTKRTLDEPQIRELLAGLARCGKRYYRPDPTTGFHTPVQARAELLKLVSQVTATRLLREAVSAGLITEERANLRQLLPEVAKQGGRSEKEADIEEEDDEPDESGHHSKAPLGLGDIEPSQLHRYQLVKSGDWYGVWDDQLCFQELVSTSKEETLERIYQLQRQGSHDPFPWRTN